jgi:hypothetical protein
MDDSCQFSQCGKFQLMATVKFAPADVWGASERIHKGIGGAVIYLTEDARQR